MKFTPSRGSKRNPVVLDLFTIIPQNFEDEVFAQFKQYAFGLMAKGLGMSGPWVTTCEDWWRSRFSDMLNPGNHAAKRHEEWEHGHRAQTNWQLFWKRLQTEVLDVTNNSARAIQPTA